MAEQSLNGADVRAGFEEMYGERMSQGMWRDGLGNTAAPMGRPAGALHRAGGDRLTRHQSRNIWSSVGDSMT